MRVWVGGPGGAGDSPGRCCDRAAPSGVLPDSGLAPVGFFRPWPVAGFEAVPGPAVEAGNHGSATGGGDLVGRPGPPIT